MAEHPDAPKWREEFEKAGLAVVKQWLADELIKPVVKRNYAARWVEESEEEQRRVEKERLAEIEERKIRLSKWAIGVSIVAVIIAALSWLFPRTDSELEKRVTRLEEKSADSPAEITHRERR